MSLDPQLLEILVCPQDKGPLVYAEKESFLYNPRLSRAYPIKDGIPIMLVEEAVEVTGDEKAKLDALAENS